MIFRIRSMISPQQSVAAPQTAAEYWYGLCRRTSTQRWMVNCHVSRGILADAADDAQTTGFNVRFYLFSDGSRLLISDRDENVWSVPV